MSDVMDVVRLKSRDNARTPMMWDNSDNGGFTPPGTKPWLRQNDEYADVNVQAQERDPDSVLSYFKQLVQVRKQHPIMVSGLIPKTTMLRTLIMAVSVLRSLRSCQSDGSQGVRVPSNPGTVALVYLLQLVARAFRVYNSGRNRYGPGGYDHRQLLRASGSSPSKSQVAAVRGENLLPSELGSYLEWHLAGGVSWPKKSSYMLYNWLNSHICFEFLHHTKSKGIQWHGSNPEVRESNLLG